MHSVFEIMLTILYVTQVNIHSSVISLAISSVVVTKTIFFASIIKELYFIHQKTLLCKANPVYHKWSSLLALVKRKALVDTEIYIPTREI